MAKGKWLTTEQKQYIANGKRNGKNATEIGDVVGVKPSSVRSYLSKKRILDSLPPRVKLSKSKISASLALKIKKQVQDTPKASGPKLLASVNDSLSPSKKFSLSTFRRFLIKNNIARKKMDSKPPPTEVNRKKRLAFAQKWLREGPESLAHVIWSDETMVKSHPNTRQEGAFLHKNTPRLTKTKLHSGGFSQMFWGCMSINGTGPLLTIDGTMDQIQYREVLEKYLIPEFNVANENGGDWMIMHDNAPCHTAKSMSQLLEEHAIPTLQWPPFSPDLNPIENLWGWMKRKLADDPPCTSQTQLEDRFLEIWRSIDANFCKRYTDNYKKRLEAVIKANGGHTKY